MSARKEIAVVGAGVSGLAAVKACVEVGMLPTCYEQSLDIGGLWNISDDSVVPRVTVTESTTFNTSKEMSCFSDFPMPRNFPNYVNHAYFMRYLHAYVEQFDLSKYLFFRTIVTKVEKHTDFKSTGQWLVHSRNLDSGKNSKREFDGVMIAVGKNNTTLLPTFPHQDTFTGTILHSSDYRDAKDFKNKCMIVVGLGNSAADIAVELSREAKQVSSFRFSPPHYHDYVYTYALERFCHM